MSDLLPFKKDSLVLYKTSPARVLSVDAKIEIELADGKKVSVRDKDISLIHPGPFMKFSDLNQEGQGELEDACAMLEDQTMAISELADLIYGKYTPATAWALCQLVLDGLYFSGTIAAIKVRSSEEALREKAQRAQKSAQKDVWHDFIDRARAGKCIDEDKPRLAPLEDFCLGKGSGCRILKDLGIQESPEHAHTLLLKLGVWDHLKNPHPARLGFQEPRDYPELPSMPKEDRCDLTHLDSYAIDDEGNVDPDDAISLEGDTLWVHVADVGAVVTPESPLDIHARGLASNLYLPEKTYTMLPHGATALLGLGISGTSPALSFGITLAENGSIASFKIIPSTVKVTRTTYESVQERISETPFSGMLAFTERYHAFRKSQNAIFLSFPEAKIRVKDGRVKITQLHDIASREMVTNAMLMAGEAASRFATERGLPFPYTSQPAPETIETPQDIAAMFSYRKQLKPSVVKASPDAHAGLGLTSYSRATSPLRRYLDLVAHQQIRASLAGSTLLTEQDIMNRIGTSAAMTGTLQKIERLSNQHWTLVYLLQNPDWQGRGIVAEIRDRYSIVIIPELAFEARLSVTHALSVNQELMLKLNGVDLPGLIARFLVV